MRHRLLFVNCYRKGAEAPLARYLAWLRAGAEALGDEAEVEVAEDGDLPGRADWSAVVLSGSQKMVASGEVDERLAAFIRACPRPLLGVCYGHQVLAQAFGGLVMRDARKHLGDETVRAAREHRLFRGFPASFAMSESHEEVVARDEALGRSFELLAESEEGLVEAIAHRSRPLFGVQFHPERSGELGVRLLANFMEVVRGSE